MITIILALTVGAGSFVGCYRCADIGLGWSIFFGLLGFVATNVTLGFAIRRKMKSVMDKPQLIMAEGQKKLQAKMQRWQMRPPGSIQAAQREIEDDTRVFVKEAIAATEGLGAFRLWVPMIGRQMATAQLQLYWTIKEFRKVDQLLPKALMIDPTLYAIKMARMYMTGASSADIGKVYEKGSKRARYNQATLLAACWSWILVQRGDVDGAFKALTEALKNSDDETLKRNHELLMNNRVGHFNNSGLGDRWYSLFLEEPKVRVQRQRSIYR